jgi:2-polyprenyl-3-methyl-5-hydroxy-6-metoxy-1,4-benzoquinol methylase
MGKMLDEEKRRKKAAKILAVLKHFLGREDFRGLLALDIGCSAGYISDELHRAGAQVVGLDIDVPGLVAAHLRFGSSVGFTCADGEAMPLADRSVDIVVFNHIYEHVVNADAVMSEIKRVLKVDGVAYFGFGNRMGVIEPHYRLPFLSWLPRRAADRYISLAGKADHYYEQFRTRPGLRKMCAGLKVWDYTYTVLAQSKDFSADDMVPRPLVAAPLALWKAVSPVMPAFVWVGTPGDRSPSGSERRVPPHLIVGA